jgi:hypothetical protein
MLETEAAIWHALNCTLPFNRWSAGANDILCETGHDGLAPPIALLRLTSIKTGRQLPSIDLGQQFGAQQCRHYSE